MPRVSEVFIAGGQPRVTYVPREELGLESQLREYLDTRYKLLSISGPTKTGKTVLVRSVVPRMDAVWVSGGQVATEADFWDRVIEQTGAFTGESVAASRTSGDKEAQQAEVAVKPGGIGGGYSASEAAENSRTRSISRSRALAPSAVAIAKLTELSLPLVVDDFHYIPQPAQLRIVRSLKDPVFDGLPVIVLSVPHRAFDAVRVEREMTGRVAQVEVPFWKPDELSTIADKGFVELGVIPEDGLVARLTAEAFSSPHLMQDFCRDLCRENSVEDTREPPIRLPAPASWDQFFKRRATGTSKAAFDRLAIGPRQRTDRIARRLKSGQDVDIYNAVLLAIATTGPLTQLRYEDIRSGLREVLAESVPQSNEITRVLEQMTKIAREEIEGEPVVDWDKEYSTLHISDPFFAYYLRWGASPM